MWRANSLCGLCAHASKHSFREGTETDCAIVCMLAAAQFKRCTPLHMRGGSCTAACPLQCFSEHLHCPPVPRSSGCTVHHPAVPGVLQGRADHAAAAACSSGACWTCREQKTSGEWLGSVHSLTRVLAAVRDKHEEMLESTSVSHQGPLNELGTTSHNHCWCQHVCCMRVKQC